jgi:hypothetical protein
VLETKVKPAIVTFLKARGLELSDEKTHITHIDDGFDFLATYASTRASYSSSPPRTRFEASWNEFAE